MSAAIDELLMADTEAFCINVLYQRKMPTFIPRPCDKLGKLKPCVMFLRTAFLNYC